MTENKNLPSLLELNRITSRLIGCAVEVHRNLGPGLLESSYQQCLAHELRLQRISFQAQVTLPVRYKDRVLDCGYRIDFLVESRLIVELKAVRELAPIHEAQLLTYLKLASVRVGLLINFNSRLLKHGIQRLVL